MLKGSTSSHRFPVWHDSLTNKLASKSRKQRKRLASSAGACCFVAKKPIDGDFHRVNRAIYVRARLDAPCALGLVLQSARLRHPYSITQTERQSWSNRFPTAFTR